MLNCIAFTNINFVSCNIPVTIGPNCSLMIFSEHTARRTHCNAVCALKLNWKAIWWCTELYFTLLWTLPWAGADIDWLWWLAARTLVLYAKGLLTSNITWDWFLWFLCWLCEWICRIKSIFQTLFSNKLRGFCLKSSLVDQSPHAKSSPARRTYL